MRACRVLAVLAVLLLASSLVAARSAKNFKPGKYAVAFVEEYRLGALRNALIPASAPQQILTSLSGVDGRITVTWVTMAEAGSSIAWGYTSGALDRNATGASHDFVDPEGPHTLRVMHTAHLSGLKPHTAVYYRVGDAQAGVWSDELQFVAPPHGDEPLALIVYGDLGLLNAQSMDKVAAEVAGGEADMVLHLGDYAYDLHTDNGTYGDTFLNNLQPIASRVPYLGVQGNHEGKWNATHYRNRFTAYSDLGAASGSGNNWWFSWEYVSGGARVHFAAVNTEMYYDYVIEGVTPPDYSSQRRVQYEWLDADLAAARKSADWVIVYGHRPMYCSDVDSLGDCTSDAQVLREGYQYNASSPAQWGLDDLIARHNVDIYFTAHEHRSAPAACTAAGFGTWRLSPRCRSSISTHCARCCVCLATSARSPCGAVTWTAHSRTTPTSIRCTRCTSCRAARAARSTWSGSTTCSCRRGAWCAARRTATGTSSCTTTRTSTGTSCSTRAGGAETGCGSKGMRRAGDRPRSTWSSSRRGQRSGSGPWRLVRA